jgi:hypothetical protein
VAKDVMDADVIINLPKLKTHKKAGMTCALKNVVGINGNKEFLPHHRVGGSDAGGDCYPGRNMVKRALEHMWDLQNSMASPRAGLMLTGLMAPLYQMLKLSKDRIGIEGSWSGNDTIWRTCLDLNRILLYGRTDASLSETVQRRVVHVVDAVIAGQGDGPLAPDPLPLNMILVGNNPVAVDYIGAQILGYDPDGIPLIRNAFGSTQWPLSSFLPGDITMHGDWGSGPAEAVLKQRPAMRITQPAGGQDVVSAP